MPSNKFKIGAVYCATPALEGAKKRLVIPIGRLGHQMQVATICELTTATVEVGGLCGREFARVLLKDGVYIISSACEMMAQDFAEVQEILEGVNRCE